MNYFFHPLAEQELNDAADYYEQPSLGLGMDFIDEIYATISLIRLFPKAWTPLSRFTRRCLVKRFPDGVIYQIVDTNIRIIAIAELHRAPRYWQSRL